MRVPSVVLLMLWLSCAWAGGVQAASGKIQKFLPHYLDLEGLHTRAPSLYERDAYQAWLRDHPDKVGGRRFDILWNARRLQGDTARIRIELRTSKSGLTDPIVIEENVEPRAFLGRWSRITVKGEQYVRMGVIMAWRITLWDGDRLLDEQRSFLWDPPEG